MTETTTTPADLTTTTVSKLTDEQREGFETLINSRSAAKEWTIQITERKISYLRQGEEVFFLASSVSTCERAICHWNGTVGDDADRRLMDTTVRFRKLSKAMKSTIDQAFDRAWVGGAIVKAGKTYLEVYAWGGAVAVDQLCEYHPNWEEEEVEGMADSILFRSARTGFVKWKTTDARIAFVAASIHATRAASEARIYEALSSLR